eukprot:GHVU01232449.1.p1 GENE.GHVU01232449.1~~GHVU01232449.1.p1  ORF type:complete len:237 (-),score=42.03 GHVU01232449.1:665-1375(-)
MMFAGDKAVSVCLSKSTFVAAADVGLLINFVLSSASLRSAETWTPVCLPSYNDSAFIYAYVNFLTPLIVVVFLSVSPDSAAFHQLSAHYARCKQSMDATGALSAVEAALKNVPIVLPTTLSAPLSLIHFAVYMPGVKQFVVGDFRREHNTRRRRKEAYRRYSEALDLLSHTLLPAHVFLQAHHEIVHVTKTADCVLFATFPDWIDTSRIPPHIHDLLAHIKTQESTYFLLSTPAIH